MVSALDFGSIIVPLSTQVYKWVPANLLLELAMRWTSIPSEEGGGGGGGGGQKYSWSLHAAETGINSTLMCHLARMQTFSLRDLASSLFYKPKV